MKKLLIPSLAIALGLVTSASVAKDDGLTRDQRTAQKIDKELAGLVPGKPVSCLPPRLSSSSDVYGETILFRVSRNLVYRNDTNGSCEGTGDDFLVTRIGGGASAPCRGDIARSVSRYANMTTGSCSFNEFVPYRKPS